jgi:1,4-alpha-glucan branching enzyme
VVSFLRWDNDGVPIACFFNFAGHPHESYRVGLPFAGRWDEILNTDAVDFGGSGVGNLGGVWAESEAWGGRPAAATITLPPLAGVYFKYRP